LSYTLAKNSVLVTLLVGFLLSCIQIAVDFVREQNEIQQFASEILAANQFAAADASFDTQTIARLLDLEERAAREAISLNNSSLDQVMKLASVNGESYPELQNVFYITPPAQREVAPVGSNSTLSPATEAYLREQELIDE
jgi:hypothetical protein